MNPRKGSCLIIGACTIDAVVDDQGTWQMNLCGGNALFAAAGANHWLAPETVKVIARVGLNYPREWLETVTLAGIDTTSIELVDFLHEGIFAASYDRSGRRTMQAAQIEAIRSEKQDSQLSPGNAGKMNIDPALSEEFFSSLEPVDFIHCAPVQPDIFFHNLGVLRRPGIWIQADPGEELAFWSVQQRLAALDAVDAYLPSAEELDEKTRQTLEEGITENRTGRPEVIALKQGRRGAHIYQRAVNKRLSIPVIPVEASDPTGAGDAFCGGFLAGMALTGNPFAAGLTGTVSASFVVECSGVLNALRPAKPQLLERLAWLEKQVEFKLTAAEEHALSTAKST